MYAPLWNPHYGISGAYQIIQRNDSEDFYCIYTQDAGSLANAISMAKTLNEAGDHVEE